MKKIMIIWPIILIIIFGSLIYIGFDYKKNIKYHQMEQAMIEVSKDFVNKNVIKVKNKKIVKLNKLLSYDEDLSKKVIKNCNGYVNIKKQIIGYSYKAVISCSNYKNNK